MKTHRNVPFFVPHAGCPHCCVFCSQTKITGTVCEKDPERELSELRALLEASGADDSRESRIAFFGGSFTAIERGRMTSLLSVAREYVLRGTASGIRISTRPDCIDGEILDILAGYGVTEIELGVQSTDDKVLAACERGHTAEDSFKAAEAIIKKGFTFGGQMMVGLPGATPESELKTASDIVSMGAKEARVYPTVVFEGTVLCDMTRAGLYRPLSLDEAVERSAACCETFVKAGVTLLRVGLHASENLASAPYGASHPAIGELVRRRIYENLTVSAAGDASGKTVEIRVPAPDISMFTGNGREAINNIIRRTGARGCACLPESGRDRFDVSVKVY